MAASDRSLRRIVINKEVVFLRQAVRKARICVVSKLAREAKKLRSKRGDEKQLQKNKRKADKLGREVTTLKTVKDDEISQYGIINLEKLQEASQDPTIPDLIRVIAKVANQKSFLPKLQQFREKFPDYREFVSTKKKKTKAREKKPSKEVEGKDNKPKQEKVVQTIQSIDENNETSNGVNNDDLNMNESSNDTGNNSDADSDSLEDEADCENKPAPTPIQSEAKKKPNVNKKGLATKKVSSPKTAVKEQPSQPIKVISKVATVKRLTDVLQEENESNPASDSEATHAENENVELQKEVDDFFMSADNNGAHFVVASIPQAETTEMEWEEVTKDRYFNKNPQRRPKAKPFNSNEKWDSGPKGNGRWNDTDKLPYNKPMRGSQYQEFKRPNGEPENRKSRRNAESASVKEPEHLHPSWEAKKKQQEILKLGFQGKKIVFGDD